MPKAPLDKKTKPARKIKIKYPDLSLKNKALYQTVSRLPVSTNSKLPAAYIKSLPMIIGVVTVLALIFVSQNNFTHFKNRTIELGNYLSLSMRAGISSYVSQLEKNIRPLPIDTKAEPKLYGGRIEVNKFSKIDINMVKMAESAHLMTARVSGIFDNF